MSRHFPSQQMKQVLLRIPEGMRERLEEAAAENGVSLTAEVLRRLEMSFPETEGWLSKASKSPAIRAEKQIIATAARLTERLDELEARVAALEQK